MALTYDYLEGLQKKKKKEISAPVASPPSGGLTYEYLEGLQQRRAENMQNIAPIRTTTNTKKEEEEGGLDFFKKSKAFEDGYDFGDITHTILGTAGDFGLNAVKGAGNLVEGIGDAINYGVADISEFFGANDFASSLREETRKSLVDKVLGGAIDFTDEYSVLGKTSDSVAQGIGMMATIMATGGALGGLGIGATGVTAATTAMTGISGIGSGMTEAYEGGATDEEARTYGIIAGTADALTELMFGGMGKTVKALGFSKGLSSADDILAKKVSGMFSSQIMKNLSEYGIKAGAEGLEEVMAGLGQAMGKKITYMSEEELTKILEDENLLEQFIVGGVTSGLAQVGGLHNANTTGTDFITGLTENEQKVIDKEVENRIAELEQDGKTLSKRAKDKIHEEVLNALDEGDISIDTIESVLGGETYDTYKSTVEREDALLKEFEELGNKTNATLKEQTRYKELVDLVEEYKSNSQRSQLKSQLSDEVYNIAKDSRLVESYNERARRTQSFEADLTKYNEKQKEIVQRAIDSGTLNNTRKTHKLVDMIAKIAADKGVSFDFTNNEKLKGTEFAVDGKTVNGFVNNDGDVVLNVESRKYLNSVVGHEITHILEGTELYTELEAMVKQFATTKGEYADRMQALRKMYTGVYQGKDFDAKIQRELTADIVGDYLFTDEKFINSLSTEKPGLFKRIYNEIKYLCKVATAGSKEARELEKVKRTFDKVYKETTKAKGETKHSISEDGDFGYHAGDLGKSEGYWNMTSSNRGTGHFGTGTYFVGDEAQINGDTYGNRPHEKVDFSKYKLYKPLLESYGFELHSNLKYINDNISLYPIASMNFEEMYEVCKEIEDAEFTRSNENATESEKAEAQRILDEAKERFEGIGYDPDYMYSDELKEKLSDLRNDYQSATMRLNSLFGYNAEEKIESALKGVYEEVSQIEDSYNARYEDSPSTRFMKAMGYEGIDVRGFKGLDNTSYGSVIYDLKGDDLARKKEIGTAKYSLSENIEAVERYSDEGVGKSIFRTDWLQNNQQMVDEIVRNRAKTETDSFKSWFNESKAVNQNGEPLLVFHGTESRFTQFKNDSGALWFSRNPMYAKAYSIPSKLTDKLSPSGKVYGGSNDRVIPAYIRAEKPADFGNTDLMFKDVVSDISHNLGISETELLKVWKQTGQKDELYKVVHSPEMVNLLKQYGYDSIKATESGTPTWGVFESNQAKSAVANKGSFDIKKADIRYSLTEEQEAYFKDSKVRDENGNLKVMYHGTSKGGHTVFDTYGSNYGLFGQGSYFTDNKSVAESYTNKGKGNNKQVYESYLNITNPLDMDAQGNINEWQKAFPDADFSNCNTNEEFYRAVEEYYSDQMMPKWEVAEAIKDFIQFNMGYDGITHIGGGRFNKADDTRHQVYIAFEPEQIKNIDNIAPTKDADIRYSISDSKGRELSPKQVEFFKDSKVRDADGNLMVVYHGTPKGSTTIFDKSKTSKDNDMGQGIYFSTDLNNASEYMGKSRNKKLYSAYVNIRKPFVVSNDVTISIEEVRNLLKLCDDRIIASDVYRELVMNAKDGYVTTSQFANSNASIYMTEMLEKSKKYDGIIDETVATKFGLKDGTKHIIALYSNQIKNADNLNPTESDDIRYSLSEDSEGRELSKEQQDYFKNAKTVDEEGRLKPFYHGTGRADRVGNVFDPNRATSGPMAYFTDSKEIADHYARDKKDTSIAYDSEYDSYETQFRVERNGKNMSVVDLWYKLPLSERNAIQEKAKHITMDDNWENVIYSEEAQYGLGNFDKYELNRHKGNVLHTLVDSWLTDGNIYGEEHKFLDVLKLVGIEDAKYMNPEFRDEKTYQVYLNITNPFDTSDISEEMLEALRTAAKNAEYVEGNSADLWDKRNIEPEKWIEGLEGDIASGTFYTWTRIPDFVTDTLKAHGYDGIFDIGGKGGGIGHTVAIPFYSEQIKNVDNLNPTTNKDIRYSLSDNLENFGKILYDNNNPLSIVNRAKSNNNSSINWVYKAEIFSVAENKQFHEKISEINQGSQAFAQNSRGEYMLPIENKIIFTDGNYDSPYIREIVEVLTEYQTEFEEIRSRIFNVEEGKSSKQDEMQIIEQVLGNGNIISYTSRNNGVYDWQNGKRKGKTRRAVVRNHLNKQYRRGNDKQSTETQINNAKVSLSNPNDIAPIRRGGLHITGDDVRLEQAPIEDIAPTVSKTEQVAPLGVAKNTTTTPTKVVDEPTENVEEDATEKGITRKDLHQGIIDNISSKFAEKGYDFVEVLKKAKNLSTFKTVDNTPQRVMEKALGYKEGQILADETVNKVAQNETEGIKWLNSFTDRKNGVLAQLSKQYNIKPGSKKSAAAQMYAEGFYVNDDNEIIEYGDKELAVDFPNVQDREDIKGLANDPRIRQIYDETLSAINESRSRNAYPEIQRLDNYYLHFRAMEDTFSRLGLPFNPNDIRAKDLPTDLNGVTADLKPGQPYFASAMHRKGVRTSFDLLGGLERYLSSAKNQIYHIDDIQTLRALRNYIADNYGQAKGLESLDTLSEEEAQERIKQVYGSHLSTFAKFLNEEANVIAGKTALIDRGLEGIIGRRGITFLDTVNKQVGSNMVGFNVSSSLTNILPVVQTFAKANKFDFVKALAQTTTDKLNSLRGKSDGFKESSPVIIRRKGADRFYRTPFQKIGDTGYILMSAVDDISTEIIARTKYNELTRKGMDSQQAHFETDKWVSRLMGDRSLGQQPQIFNSKMLGMLTKFQLEVRNQLDSQFYDTIQEAKVSNEEIEDSLLRNAKTAAKVTSTFFQLAVMQHLFGKAFESVAGYNPAFDIIEVLIKTFGLDDDEEDEDTVLDNIEEGFLTLLEDLPYASTLTGGRIPISSALPIRELVKGEDEYGNEVSRWETVKETVPYYLLPTGYGQLKKTKQGLGMFDKDLPIAGSYTDSGNLRFPVEDNLKNRVQAGLFGQYANKNARAYFDDDIAPLKENQINEFIDVDMPIKDYWKYIEGLKDFDKQAEKVDYINGLDISEEQKNVLKSYLYDEEGYKKDNPEKYAFLENEGIGFLGWKEADEETQESWSWAFKHQDEYRHYKENGVMPEDYSAYYVPMLEFDDEGDSAYQWSYDYPEKASLGKVFSNGVKEYREYASYLSNVHEGDNTKATKIDYIFNQLDIDYGAKCILFRSQYKKDNTYNDDIVDYLNNRDDISQEEMITILRELGATVDSEGYIYW